MSSLVNVAIHPSQFPERIRSDLINSLRTRQVNHKFHYDSFKQTQKWLALHQAYSPSRTDPDCAASYDLGFVAAARQITGHRAHLLGLGCGGGQKDARLLKLLSDSGKEVFYTPLDVSTAMVLTAQQTAMTVVPGVKCCPLVCDLTSAEDIASIFGQQAVPTDSRLVTFFGMIPNFEPLVILPRLAGLLRPGDVLLFSANLAPGPDYATGVQRVMPLYDNAPTRDWLMTFLLDLGVEPTDGEMRFRIEDGPLGSGLKRIAADFEFNCSRDLQIFGEHFQFRHGELIRLFFSYRHTRSLVRSLLVQHRLQVLDEWITASEEEGVFLCATGA